MSDLDRGPEMKLRAARDAAVVARAREARYVPPLSSLPEHTGAREPLMPLVIDVVRTRASVGEIAAALESVWGRYQPVRPCCASWR